MRTLGFRTHILLSLAGAIGLVATLGRPWYAAAPVAGPEQEVGIGDINGPLNSFFDVLRRAVTDTSGVSGWDSLDHWAAGLALMAGIAAVGALFCLAPPLQAIGRDLLRYGAIAAFALTAWKLVDTPASVYALELRNGALAAGFTALVLLICAMGVANAPLRRKVPVRRYVAPPPPPAYGSASPPGS